MDYHRTSEHSGSTKLLVDKYDKLLLHFRLDKQKGFENRLQWPLQLRGRGIAIVLYMDAVVERTNSVIFVVHQAVDVVAENLNLQLERKSVPICHVAW